MTYKNILVTGGAGFVGSNLAIKLKLDYPKLKITCLDNLKRRGSELALPRLREAGVEFRHGDIRNPEDLQVDEADLILECSAEPSVLAGIHSSPAYVINTNLLGTVNCLEQARRHKADILFLSTSRIYPMDKLNQLEYKESSTRFELLEDQTLPGASSKGISERFPLAGPRSFYGATKLASELIINEYSESYKVRAIINRCSVITGPWQMGKIDQGVFVLWLAKHYYKKPLAYIGYGGTGKQVRDFIHIDDLYRAVKVQLDNFDDYAGTEVYNIGGGLANSVSLQELTKLCEEVTGHKVKIESIKENRPADVRIYYTDSSKFLKKSGLSWQKDISTMVQDVYGWIRDNEIALKPLLS